MDVDKAPGLRRVVWNMRGDPPAGGEGGARGRGQGSGQEGLGGRGGRGAPLATSGLYRAQLGRQVGDKVEPIGAPQAFRVTQIQP
jgi:hypothetical protein